MARPRKAENERRSEPLYIRLTPDEMSYVESQADKAGLDRVTFARDYLLGARISAMPNSVKAAKADAADLLLAIDGLTGQTKRVGSNVNQLAAAVHRGSDFVQWWSEVGAELKGHLAELETLMSKVSQRL